MGCGGASGWRAGSSARWRGSGASPPPSVREASPLSQAVSLRARRGSFDQLPGLEVELYHHQMPADIPCEFSLQTAGQLVQQLGVGELVPSQGREDGRLERLVVGLGDRLVPFAQRVFGRYHLLLHLLILFLSTRRTGRTRIDGAGSAPPPESGFCRGCNAWTSPWRRFAQGEQHYGSEGRPPPSRPNPCVGAITSDCASPHRV